MRIAIDFGTSNTCAAFHDGAAGVIFEHGGAPTLPSAIAWDDNDSLLVGMPAERYGRRNPQRGVGAFKRVMGMGATSAAAVDRDAITGPDGWAAYDTPAGVKLPEELAAILIATCLDAAEARLGERPDGLVLTRPSMASQAYCHALIAAGEMAGIDRSAITLLPEPVAAGIKYGFRSGDKYRTCMVIDVGAGTADISIHRVAGRNGAVTYEAIAGNGDVRLGGIWWDRYLAESVRENFEGRYPGVDLSQSPGAIRRLQGAAEDTKKALSAADRAECNVPQIYQDATNGLISLSETVTREAANGAWATLRGRLGEAIDRTIAAARETDSAFHAGRIDELIMVGGMSRVPVIVSDSEAKIGRKALVTENPETVVAQGAAIHAAWLDGRIRGVAISDALTQSVGIVLPNRAFLPLIPRGTVYPVEQFRIVGNAEEGAETIAIDIRMGNEPVAERNRSVRYHLAACDPRPVGQSRLGLRLRVDASGMADFTAEPITEG